MISFSRVRKAYPERPRPALDGVTFHIDKGELVYLIGPSGSGKSTVLKIIAREIVPTRGDVSVNGRDVVSMRRSNVQNYRRSIGYVTQNPVLIPHMNAYENVALGLLSIGKTRAVVRRVVPEVLELASLERFSHLYPNEMAAGTRHKVALARALVNRPLVLLLDDPTSSVDPDTSIEMMRLVDRINRTATTVIMATSSSNVVNQVRRRVIELAGGRVVRDEPRGNYS